MNNQPFQPLPSSTAPDVVTRKEYSKNTIPNRSSYSPKNAIQFQGVFDKMIATQQNQEIHCAATGFKARTLYIKANDALKWLAECHPEADKYTLLKGRISISQREDRILIYFKTSLVTIIKQGTVAVNGMTSSGWKDDLQTWLETAQDGQIFERSSIVISADDKVWLYGLLAGIGPGVEVEVGLNMVRVMR